MLSLALASVDSYPFVLVRSRVVSNIAVTDRFGTSNPALTKVSSAHDFHLELGTNATSKFGHKPLACLDFHVAIEPRDGLALLVHVYLPFRERIAYATFLFFASAWGRRCSRG